MQAWRGALWGALGGAVVEAYDIVAVARATGRWPWLDPARPAKEMTHAERWNAFGVWLFATIVRIAAGGGGAAAASSQVTGELAAFGLGVAGPLALERILATVHVSPESTVAMPSPVAARTARALPTNEKVAANPAEPPASADVVEGE
jgi:hypothetical protein